MIWSKLKKRVEGRFAASVAGHVKLWCTGYHGAPDHMGRAWITLDGKEIAAMCQFTKEYQYGKRAAALRQERGCEDFRCPESLDGYYEVEREVEQQLVEEGIFSRGDFESALEEYLSLAIDDILKSQNPIIRALGMLDKRLGKRRLAARAESEEKHPLVRQMLQVRGDLESRHHGHP